MTMQLSDVLHLPPQEPLKVAFFDIDGTLLDKEGRYSRGLLEQVRRIQSLGVKTAIASGRPVFATSFLMQELNLMDPGVFCTGAHIYDPRGNKTLQAAYLAPNLALQLLAQLRNLDIYYELYCVDSFFYETDYGTDIRVSHSHHLRAQPLQTDLSTLLREQPALKFLIGAEGDSGSERLRQLEQAFPSLTFAYAHFPAHPTWHFVSVIDGQGCKEKAFNWLLAYYGVSSKNVISFGDSQSDTTFLQLAGVGVAMGNATEEVKSVANWVTKNAWDDGVAYALSRLI